MPRNKPLVAATALLIGLLSACGSDAPEAPPEPPPIAAADMAYIAEDAGVDREQLHRLIDPLFSDPVMAETRAVVVVRYGEVIAERYGPGYSAQTPLISWSMAKSVTSVLVGLLVADGRLALDEPAPVPAWQSPGDPRRDITLRNLLHMASGLDHTEGLDAVEGSEIYNGDAARMLFLDGADDMATYAEGRPIEARPGEKFEYSSNTSVILADIIARTLTDSNDPDTRRDAVLDYARGRLFDPLGMASMTPEFDASGTMIGGSIIHADTRDWAKFGEFLRTQGSIGGAQIVPRGWVKFMTTPSRTNPEYGGHIWLNRSPADGGEAVLFPDLAPQSAFACLGHLGQYVIVSPEQGLTLVRLGKTQDDQRAALREQLGRILGAFPSG